MYELVNTSLPNGLIAGTHGFATVAMTKGVPDALRTRLEALCAYTHRTSAHDETYYRQNPVNWFHVVLPQGEHVVGRVAPSDFDYTGRTNRLARLRVFGATEMPEIGGADILLKERQWFVQPWQENPRYLDDNKKVSGALRMASPVHVSSASAWEASFGAKGSLYAQQVAWQLEKNLSTGGKTIYFKTSAAWDVSGERLLGLFADVVNLLPDSLRQQVTFSTYPASLPSGTVCNLRGVHDQDRLFNAVSATQAWIDCENGKIVHPELLPTSGAAKDVEPNAGRGNSQSDAGNAVGGAERPRRSTSYPSAATSVSERNPYLNIIASQKKGPDMFIVGVVVAGLIVLLSAAAFFFWMMQSNRKQMEESGAAAAVAAYDLEAEKEKLESARRTFEQDMESSKAAIEPGNDEEAAKAEEERQAKEKEAREAEEKRKQEERNREEATERAKAEEERQKAEKLELDRLKVAYLDAEEFCCPGKPSYESEMKMGSSKRDFLEKDVWRVYYYVNGSVTNALAGFVPNEKKPNHSLLRWDEGLSKKREELPKAPSGFVLWYNLNKKRVYIDLNWREDNGRRGQWFANSSKVDLSTLYFGPDPNFVKLWEKYRQEQTKYLVSWKHDETIGAKETILTEETIWTEDQMIVEIQKEKARLYDAKIKTAKENLAKHEKNLNDMIVALEDAHKHTNALHAVSNAYYAVSDDIHKLNIAKMKLAKEKPKDYDERIKEINKDIEKKKKHQKSILSEGIENPTGKQPKAPVYNTIAELESEIRRRALEIDECKDEIAKKQREIETAETTMRKLEAEKKGFLDQFREQIRRIYFEVSVDEKIKE